MQTCYQLLEGFGSRHGKEGGVNLEKICLLIYPLPCLIKTLNSFCLVSSASVVLPDTQQILKNDSLHPQKSIWHISDKS